eukprot:PhM_4_TR3380/c0_g1_i2/m.10671
MKAETSSSSSTSGGTSCTTTRLQLSHIVVYFFGVCTALVVYLAFVCTVHLQSAVQREGASQKSSSLFTNSQRLAAVQRPPRRIELCLFVHADNSSGLSPNRPYADELDAMLGTWADDNTFIYTYGDLSVPDGSAHVVHMNRSKWGPHFAAAYRAAYPGTPEEQLWKNEKTFPMWMHVRANIDNPALFARCAWFMRVDTDTYVNRRRIMAYLESQNLHANSHVYTGALGGYRDFSFGNGGTGYILSHVLFRSVNFTQCWVDVALRDNGLLLPGLFEDVEVMWCLYRHFDAHMHVDHWDQMYYDNGNPSAVAHYIDSRPECVACYPSWHKVLPHDMYVVHARIKDVFVKGNFDVRECAARTQCLISRVSADL